MAHVQLDANGRVTGVYGGPQHGLAGCVDVADNDPAVRAT